MATTPAEVRQAQDAIEAKNAEVNTNITNPINSKKTTYTCKKHPNIQVLQQQANPSMVVNIADDKNFIEFILPKRVIGNTVFGKPKGLSLPNHHDFNQVIATVTNDLMNQRPDWMRIVRGAKFNQYGIGVFRLNYGDKEGCDMFRNLIRTRSTDLVQYESYPSMDIIKANGISIYLHAGFAPIEIKTSDWD